MYTLMSIEDLADALNAIFAFKDGITIHIFGVDILIYTAVLYSFVALAVLVLLAILVRWHVNRADVHKKPSKVLVVAEMLHGFAAGNTEDMKYAKIIAPFAGTFFIYLILINTSGFWGIDPPASNMIVAFSLGLTMFILMHALSIAAKKWGYFKQFLEPFPVFLPFNLIELVSQPITVSIRIFGNMVAGVSIALILKLAMSAIPLGWLFSFVPMGAWSFYADLFVGCVQSLVFTMLTINYIKERLH